MNHRPRTVSPLVMCLALLLTLAVGSGSALAQAIPPAARTAADATPHKPVIDAFVKAQVARLQDVKTPANVKRGRDALEAAVASNASPSFFTVYATSIDQQFAPLAASKELMVRLNAAIVVARVAAKAQNPALAPSAAKFMKDPSEAVALWGVKAAKSMIPYILNLNGAVPDPLTPALIGVVKQHWNSGPIIYEAYDALRLNTTPAPAGGAPAAPGAMPPANDGALRAVVPHMLTLLTFRVNELYIKGVPPQPTAESYAIQFLTQSKVWGLLNPQERLAVVQQAVNLITLAGQHAGSAATAELRWPLVTVLANAGSGLQVTGENLKDPAISGAGKSVRAISQATPPDTIVQITSGVSAAVMASTTVKGLKPSPTATNAGVPLSPNEPVEESGDAPATAGTPAGGAGAGGGGAGATTAGGPTQ